MIAQAENEDRNEWGLPLAPIEVTAHERSHQTTRVDIDNSKNKALPWIVFSWFLAGGALIGVFVMALLMPQIIDAKVNAGVSKAREEMAQQVATANAVANEARVHARVALDKVEDFRAQLAEKGINVELDGH